MAGFDPDQPRDEKGQWTAGGSSAAIQNAASDKKKYTVGKLTGIVMDKEGNAVGFFDEMSYEEKEKYGVQNYGVTDDGKYMSAIDNEQSDDLVSTEKQAEKAIQKFKKYISDDHVYYINYYTGEHYSEINSSLRQGREAEYRAVKHIDEFLEKAPKYNGSSWRGLKFLNVDGYESFKSSLKEGVITDLAYGSTSVDESIVKNFQSSTSKYWNVTMKIKGKSGVYLGSISQFEHEKEVLFPRNSSFKVLKTEEKTREISPLEQEFDPGMKPGKHLYVELEEIKK